MKLRDEVEIMVARLKKENPNWLCVECGAWMLDWEPCAICVDCADRAGILKDWQ